jgi:hypothetical protein
MAIGVVVGVVVGVVSGLGAGLGSGLAAGLGFGPGAGLAAGIVAGLVAWLRISHAWPTRLAAAQLATRWHTPLRLMNFLDDARERNVLRTVGPVYQFRHARLQDRLAAAAADGRNNGKQRLLTATGHGTPRTAFAQFRAEKGVVVGAGSNCRPSASSGLQAASAPPRMRPTSEASPGSAGDSAEVTLRLVQDHDRIAAGMNDIVVRRLFSAGLSLETALGLMGDHLGAAKVQEAIDELDLAIRDFRDVLVDHPGQGRSSCN